MNSILKVRAVAGITGIILGFIALCSPAASHAQSSPREVIVDGESGPADFVGGELDIPDGYTKDDVTEVELVHDLTSNSYEAEFYFDRPPAPGPRPDPIPPRRVPVRKVVSEVTTEETVEVSVAFGLVKYKITRKRTVRR